MLLNTSDLPRGLAAVALVVAQEDVLEAGLVAGQRDHWKLRRRLDHRVRGALHGESNGQPVVERLDLGDPIEPGERVGRDRLGEGDRDLVALDVFELMHATDADDAAVADDRDT